MKRVMIVGQPGAGKSTLARQLGARTGLPVVHIDHIHWTPGWVEREREEKLAMMRAAEREESWIIEGGLSATWDTRLPRADTVIGGSSSQAARLAPSFPTIAPSASTPSS